MKKSNVQASELKAAKKVWLTPEILDLDIEKTKSGSGGSSDGGGFFTDSTITS